MDAVRYIPPVPQVPGPRISAPAAARDPKGIVPAPREQENGEPPLEEVLDAMPRVFPHGPLGDAFNNAMKLVNKVAFRPQTSPGAPIAPTPGSWSFAAIGDYGSGPGPLTDVTNNIARHAPKLVLTMGDNVYYNGTEEEFRKKWDPPTAFGDIRRTIPVMPSLGNHDLRADPAAEPYFRRFPELGNARYYSFDEGGVHFVALNSNESVAPDSTQYRWLDQDLTDAADAKFTVMYFHHPMYSSYPKRQGAMQGYLAPLIAKHGVELVLTGHEHNYSRMKPINAGGSVEVIAGGGGHTLHPFLDRQQPFQAYRDVDYGHVEVEVTGDALIGRYVVRDGSVRDTFRIPQVKPIAPADAAAGAAALTSA